MGPRIDRGTLASGPVCAVGESLWAVVAQEVQIKLVVRVGELSNLLHAQELVVLETCLGVFHPQPWFCVSTRDAKDATLIRAKGGNWLTWCG